MGVSLFFILSGYILGYVYVKVDAPKIDTKKFLTARFARIYPAYALSLLFQLPLIGQIIINSAQPAKRALIGVGSLIVHLALLQAWAPIFNWHWNQPSWTISVEAFFYIVFTPLAMWSARKVFIRRSVCLIFFCYLMMLVPPAILLKSGIGWNEQPRPEAFLLVVFAPIFRIPEFLIGLLLYGLNNRLRSVCSQGSVSRIGTIVLYSGFTWVAAVIFLSHNIPYVMRYNGIADIGFGAIIFGLAISRGLISRILSIPALVLLGEASYSVYIFQAPIVDYFRIALQSDYFSTFATHAQLFAVYLVALTGISVFSFKYVESPIRLRIREWYASSKRTQKENSTPKQNPKLIEDHS
jgi:peptidoglycan/LPS O-acetylase OafA/YrhL